MQTQVPAVARRLHVQGEVRHPRLAGRRPRQRARDGRARGGGRDRAQGARRRGAGAHRDRRLGRAGARTSRRPSTPPRSRAPPSTPTSCAAPTPRSAAQMIERIDARAEGRRLAGRRGRGGRARRARRPGRAGVRQARGRPRQGDAVAAGGQGLRDRQRLRRHAADRQPAQRSVLRRRRGAIRTRTQPLGRRAGRHLQRRGRSSMRVAFKPTATILREQQTVDADGNDTTHQGRAAATIRACCRARCRSSRR